MTVPQHNSLQEEERMPSNAAQQAGATFDTYMQIDGVEGEALDDKHKNWIELLSYSHNIVQPVSSSRGSAGGAATGRSDHGDFTVSMFLDKSYPKLAEAASSGKPFKKIKIESCRAGGTQLKFFEITLEEVLISSLSIGSGRDDLAVVTVALNYSKIEWTYTQQKRADGSGGGNVAAKYDLAAGKV
jgi:type VI secretion system secreted protein Hcp